MESQKSTHVLLDLRPMGQNALLKKFPNIVSTVREFGIDPVNEPVPVSPAAHYFRGGIMTDPFGQTSLPGLYAIGECASVGLHGANRLASNSLLEAGVMALRAASSIVSCRSTEISRPAKIKKGMRSLLLDVAKDVPKLREVMYAKVGLIRSKTSLEDCLNFLNSNLTTVLTDSRQAIQAANVQLIARLITRSALLRSESRGAHFREDFPLSNDLIFGKRLIISQQNYDWMLVDNQCEAMSTAAARQVLNISA
jgi:aspartate oxidase